MKPGTGGDPFGDDDGGEDSTDEPQVKDAEDSTQTLPWAVQRDSVKADRAMVQFFLQADTQVLEREFERDVEAETGYGVHLTDLREAAYLVAMDHPDEVADVLDEWGCEHS